MARWLLLLAEFDIVCLTPKAIKSQALADLLAHFPNGEFEPPSEALPGEELDCSMAEEVQNEWTLSFDGSSTSLGGGAGINLASQADGSPTSPILQIGFQVFQQ